MRPGVFKIIPYVSVTVVVISSAIVLTANKARAFDFGHADGGAQIVSGTGFVLDNLDSAVTSSRHYIFYRSNGASWAEYYNDGGYWCAPDAVTPRECRLIGLSHGMISP